MVQHDGPVLALRAREAAKALGISPRLLWQLTNDGVIPCVRVGNGKRPAILYSTTGLEAWLRNSQAAGKAVGNDTGCDKEPSGSNDD